MREPERERRADGIRHYDRGDVELFTMRDGVDAEYNAKKLNQQLNAKVKPIPVSPEITQYLDPKNRLDFLGLWKSALAAGGK